MIQQVLHVGTSKFGGGAGLFCSKHIERTGKDVADTKTLAGPANVLKGLRIAEESLTKPNRREFLIKTYKLFGRLTKLLGIRQWKNDCTKRSLKNL